MHDRAVPVGGPIMTGPFKLLLGFLGIWALLLVWRFSAGIGAVSGLSDGYPWGIWIAFDVVTGTALACGGYAIAILAYILNRGQYHPLVRPAILTSALGYSMAALAIIIDVGRPWYMWRIPIAGFGGWNFNSALLEVALCVMAYVVVLWIELSPAFFEKWKGSKRAWLAKSSERGLKIVNASLLWIIALGLLLPTMHQSSLGTVMLLAGPKLHQLWHTAQLPLLFLISCIGMGYAVVVFESAVSSAVFKRQREHRMLASLSKAMVWVLGLFVLIRLVDLIARGRLALMFNSFYSVLFWLEMGLFIVPMVMLARRATRQSFRAVFTAALLMMLGGSLYRFDAYLVAFNPGAAWGYFPSLPELLITFGVVAFEIAIYIVIIKQFPIMAGAKGAADAI